jgi:growth arrest-specific protein 8
LHEGTLLLRCCAQDKINAFWEITKKELEDRKAEMRNLDRQMEEMEDLHQRELKACDIL